MKELKFYKYAVAGLVLLNILMMSFFFLTKPHPPGAMDANFVRPSPTTLHLTDQQEKEFIFFAEKHQQQMRELKSQQSALLKPYFETLTQTGNPDRPDSLLITYEDLERQKVEATYEHFEEVKLILDTDQIAHFEAFMDQALNMILFDAKNSPPPRRKQ